MQSCVLNAPGKINLYLEITGDRPDGYHRVVMVLQSVELSDRVRLTLKGNEIRLRCEHPDVPHNESNLAYQAAALLQERTGQEGGVEIAIEKQIPVGAGMAGGSTDAAAVLVGLNQLWNLGLTLQELQALGSELGSDIPFCVHGGTMLAIGRGEKLSPLPDLQPIAALLGKHRDLSVSTAWAYTHYKTAAKRDRGPISAMLSAIAHQDAAEIGRYLYNDLESVVLPYYPQVAQLKATLQQAGGFGATMSGSGPTVFALLPSIELAKALQANLAAAHPEIAFWVTQTSPAGISMVENTPVSPPA
ncbi:4-(cytidine 5'-diphospho)-2-C-methyl-D-erythritol kinase [Synechococcus sp. PCC 7336]|uniref:4-(cytidine 5'-diphospho)-2-C-methyl-D-erythritol kinase n=1 Tax=Synechococcus sp. PCC 7336 TaxID=195250 RepID=UPI0003487301|nr:4-(cytidine 5'-diphospho)-2-C-methyl-D-erythritol kinase [Synechococcus sp. PCC 7336]